MVSKLCFSVFICMAIHCVNAGIWGEDDFFEEFKDEVRNIDLQSNPNYISETIEGIEPLEMELFEETILERARDRATRLDRVYVLNPKGPPREVLVMNENATENLTKMVKMKVHSIICKDPYDRSIFYVYFRVGFKSSNKPTIRNFIEKKSKIINLYVLTEFKTSRINIKLDQPIVYVSQKWSSPSL